MRRIFWATLGVGLGAVVGAQVVRWANRTKAKYAPPNIAREASNRTSAWFAKLAGAIEEGRQEMAAREIEIRAELGLPPH